MNNLNINKTIPLVSVLMTAYNREKYIAEAIESVLASSYTNFELIIVDDCSIDRTVEIAKFYEAKDNRIKVYVNEKNLGDYSNRNKAATFAKGKYLKYLDADDTIYKFSLDYMVNAMEKFPEAALGLSLYVRDPKKPFPQMSTPIDTFREEYLGKGFLGNGPSASIIKKEFFDIVGGFPGIKFMGDTELWFKLADQYPVVKLQAHLIWWRQHSEQQIVEEKKNFKVINARYKFSIEQLLNHKSFFTNEEFKFALKRIKRNHARGLLRMIFYGNLKIGYELWKMSNLNLIELLTGFKSYVN